VEFARALVPALATIIGELSGKKGLGSTDFQSLLDTDLDGDSLRAALDVVLENLSDTRVDEIMELMSQHTDIFGPGFGDQGAPLDKNFDDHFAGRYKAMYRWLVFAVRANFSDFFGESGGTPVNDGMPPQ
jgi:hypothetical protein